MLKFARVIEGSILSIAIICFVISLADLFDILRFVGDRLPMLTFLLISLLMSYIAIIQKQCIEIHENVKYILLEGNLEKLNRMIVEHIDHILRKVLEDDYFLDILEFLQGVIKESRVPVNDWVRFRHYYVRTLQLFPKATFLSAFTSITGHLWKDPMIGDALAHFIKSGGKMKLVFFLKDEKELDLPEVKAVLTGLQTIGVQVSVVFNTSTPNKLKKNFIVESKGKIGWEMHFDSEGSVTTTSVTTNREQTASYRKTFEKLRGSALHTLITV